MDIFPDAKDISPPRLLLGRVVANYDASDINKGKVKVEYYSHWTQNNITGWMRTVSLMAGKNRGVYILPEVGDEVLVAFIGGDPDCPCVIGSLWNSENTYPEGAVSEENTEKLLVTRSGIKITLSDKKDKETIVIKTPKNTGITIADEGGCITFSHGEGKTVIEMKGEDGSVTVTSEKELVLKSKDIRVSANNKLSFEGNNIEIKAKSKFAAEGAQVQIDGKGTTKLSSSGVLDIKGGMVKING